MQIFFEKYRVSRSKVAMNAIVFIKNVCQNALRKYQ